MKIEISDDIRKQAKAPHDLYMVNMFLFNIPMVAGTLAYSIGGKPMLVWAVIGALLVSLGIVAYIHIKASRAEVSAHWFARLHWKLSVKRCRILLIGYAVAIVIIGAGVLIGSGMADTNMQAIMTTVFTRIGIVPALLIILVTAILEGQAMHLVNNGIVPKRLAEQFPPPDDVKVLDSENESA
ncbi:MAG: hypothetical protein ABW162_03375 [Candidatus Sedimenticola sp. PURPLELP]